MPWAIPVLTRRSLRAARKAADAARDRRDWAAAAKAYRRVLKIEPNRTAIHVQLGHMLKEAGDLDGAGLAYETAYRLDPQNSDLLRWYGNLDLRRGQYTAAAWKLARSVAIDGNPDAARDLIAVQQHARAGEARAGQPVGAAEPGRRVGTIDVTDGDVVMGWAIDPARPDEAVEVEFRIRDHVVGRSLADIPREDLVQHGGFGFRAQLDLTGISGDLWLTAHLASTGEKLDNSPVMIDRHPSRTPIVLATDARFEIVKPFPPELDGEIALFVTHSGSGALKPHVPPYLQALHSAGVSVLLIVVADNPAFVEPEVLDLVAGAVVRENRGYDFACWAHATRLYPQVYSAAILYLLNDSVVAATHSNCFTAMLERVRRSAADVVGLTESYQHQWHVQSYFLALKPNALSSWALHFFFDTLQILRSKDAIIRTYECRLASLLENAGCSVDVLFRSPAVRDPTVFGWQGLLEAGFPFVKVLLLRGSFPAADAGNWRPLLARRGFDVANVEATLAVAKEWWEPAKNPRLLARPSTPDDSPRQPLKVAFFGPWNYDNGLGAASRSLVAAIRRCGVQLNLHPVKKPFHIHKAVAPAVDITDFAGPADIAIVHLNSDSWHLLTDLQRDTIRHARKRVGHWVWEMGHIAPAWRHDFSSVDRIWAPSGYCADIFSAEGEAPVDVVPYPVPLIETQVSPDGRAALLGKLGIQPSHRVVLYVFDGSSYLVRKNPAALVRAFVASGLGKRGWSLVLKTKHLFDRPAEGRELEALAGRSEGVVLVNASLPQSEVTSLIASCDVYASPHCSEGFGLTIAEAMAAAKPVVVTDFGGSTEFVDTSCGYPVLAHPWKLEADFGHYTKDGVWARVDEAALAQALLAAAAAIEHGDGTIPEAARHRVATRLSYDAVAAAIRASFEAILSNTMPISRPSSRISSTLSSGMSVSGAKLGTSLVLVALRPDLGAPRQWPAGLPRDRDHWIVFAPEDACLAPTFEQVVQACCLARPDVDVFYADDVALGEERFRDQVHLKPAFDTTLLVAKDYVTAPLVVRASALDRLGGLHEAAGAAVLYDLLFRADALGMAIERIPVVLLAWKGKRPGVSREARRAVVQGVPALAGHHDIVDGLRPDTLQLRRRLTDDDVPCTTVIIPTCRSTPTGGEVPYVARLLDALAATDWPMARLTVLIGDDVAGQPDWEARAWPFTLIRRETPRRAGERFNYAAKMNVLWRTASTEHVVMMNDDVVPTDAGWLKALMTFAMEEHVGGVGARLLLDNGRIQHAGIAPLFGTVAHAWFGLPVKNSRAYGDWPLVHREWSAVTGAVFATRRTLLQQVNGFEERFTVEFNDVDLCLRLRALGYRIIYTPHAEFRHTEKASRGETPPPGGDIALFLARWSHWLAEDPAYHPSLRKDQFDIEPTVEPDAWFLS